MNLLSPFSKGITVVLMLMALSKPSAIAQPKWQVAKHTSDYQDWQRMPVGSGFPVKTFAFHDFNGDRKAEIFYKPKR